jgi:hypothetical protein
MKPATADELRPRFEGLTAGELQRIATSPDYSTAAQAVAREILTAREATPPTLPCPVHPHCQVVGTCVRCGGFLCVECDPAWARTKRGQCVACQQRVEESGRGIGLRAGASGLTLVGLVIVLRVARASAAFGLWELVATLAVLAVVAAILLTIRKR